MFFRYNGKHFFRLYFTINGGLLLIAAVLVYFIFKIYFEFMFHSLTTGVADDSNSLGALFSNNASTIIIVALFGFLFLVFITLLQFAFPLVYLDFLDQKKGTNFGTKDITKALKSNLGKFLKFIIGTIFIFLPLISIIMFANILLCAILVGFPLLFITLPTIMAWTHQTFYHYITGKERFFKAISLATSSIKQQFWQIILSTIVVYVIIQVVMTIMAMVPYIFGLATIFTNPRGTYNQTEGIGIFTIMMVSVMVISLLANYILNNLVLINQGLIYYSLKEYNESISSTNSIDLIGTESE